MKLKLPPKIKVLEALGSIADKRIKIIEKDDIVKAICTSSLGDKQYKIAINLKNFHVYSSDNGTLLRGYIGYPIISLLMLLKLLPFDEEIANRLKGIKWKTLNEKYKSYYKVEFVIGLRYLEDLQEKAKEFEEIVMEKLKSFNLILDESLKF